MISPGMFETDGDRWGRRKGARWVGRDEFEAEIFTALPRDPTSGGMVLQIMAKAIAAACDEGGVLLNWRTWEWFPKYVPQVMRESDEDDDDLILEWTPFTSLVTMESELRLQAMGFLGQRGNGDSSDVRLALPA